MKQQEVPEFSWPTLFIVTSLSFFSFAGFIKLIHGSAWHAALFFKIGFAAFVFFAIAYAKANSKQESPKKKARRSRARRNRVIEY